MKITIGIPVYGVEKFIERCCNSIFGQTYENLEILFVNDNTPDRSIEIIKETLKKFPNRIPQTKIINHEHNKGLAAARNTIINNITGEYIIWVDSDDYIETNTVEILIQELKLNNYDIISFGTIIHHTNYQIRQHIKPYNSSKDFTIALISRETPVSIWGRIIKTSLYKENKIYALEGNNMGEDYQVLPILSYYSKNILFLDIPLYHYDFTNENSYCNSFSAVKMTQMWNSYTRIESFFINKGNDYFNAVEEGKLKILILSFKDCLKKGFNKKIFQQLHIKTHTIKKNIKITTSNKIILKIPNLFLLKIYIYTARKIKRFITAINLLNK